MAILRATWLMALHGTPVLGAFLWRYHGNMKRHVSPPSNPEALRPFRDDRGAARFSRVADVYVL